MPTLGSTARPAPSSPASLGPRRPEEVPCEAWSGDESAGGDRTCTSVDADSKRRSSAILDHSWPSRLRAAECAISRRPACSDATSGTNPARAPHEVRASSRARLKPRRLDGAHRLPCSSVTPVMVLSCRCGEACHEVRPRPTAQALRPEFYRTHAAPDAYPLHGQSVGATSTRQRPVLAHVGEHGSHASSPGLAMARPMPLPAPVTTLLRLRSNGWFTSSLCTLHPTARQSWPQTACRPFIDHIGMLFGDSRPGRRSTPRVQRAEIAIGAPTSHLGPTAVHRVTSQRRVQGQRPSASSRSKAGPREVMLLPCCHGACGGPRRSGERGYPGASTRRFAGPDGTTHRSGFMASRSQCHLVHIAYR